MKVCPNCKNDTRDSDIYCRSCGIKIEKNNYYVLINVFTFLTAIGIVLIVALFVTSLLVD